jgi:hypothetical protein
MIQINGGLSMHHGLEQRRLQQRAELGIRGREINLQLS